MLFSLGSVFWWMIENIIFKSSKLRSVLAGETIIPAIPWGITAADFCDPNITQASEAAGQVNTDSVLLTFPDTPWGAHISTSVRMLASAMVWKSQGVSRTNIISNEATSGVLAWQRFLVSICSAERAG
jgi:hypothetical protein